jgi:hypothetical protein
MCQAFGQRSIRAIIKLNNSNILIQSHVFFSVCVQNKIIPQLNDTMM